MTECSQAVPDAILFDLDNTLCTFVEAKRAACRAVISAAGSGDAGDLFEYFRRGTYNFEDPANITDYLTDTGVFTPDLDEMARAVFDAVKLDTIALYPGVIESLEILLQADVKIALITDALSRDAQKRMKKLGIDHYFPVLITPDRTGKKKPDHTQFLEAMRKIDADHSSTWVVGDSIHREIIPGHEMGLTTVYARYGDWLHPARLEVNPHYILDSFSDIVKIAGLA
jgi:putative hydrolase of the HAD superfamily